MANRHHDNHCLVGHKTLLLPPMADTINAIMPVCLVDANKAPRLDVSALQLASCQAMGDGLSEISSSSQAQWATFVSSVLVLLFGLVASRTIRVQLATTGSRLAQYIINLTVSSLAAPRVATHQPVLLVVVVVIDRYV